MTMAISNPDKFVLKPQREGGGNNLYGDDIKQVSRSLMTSRRVILLLTAKTCNGSSTIKLLKLSYIDGTLVIFFKVIVVIATLYQVSTFTRPNKTY